MNEKLPNQVEEFSAENCPNETLVASLFWMIFDELPFFHFPPPSSSIRGKDSQI